jgi:hypothetical protein
MLTPFSNAARTNGQEPDTKVTVGGQYIAKATVNYPPWQRARDAARWLRGQLRIEPTVKLAARTFGVSEPLVREARELLEQEERSKRRNNGRTLFLSDSAVDNIVREVGIERIWASVDRLTQPSLPFAGAAE